MRIYLIYYFKSNLPNPNINTNNTLINDIDHIITKNVIDNNYLKTFFTTNKDDLNNLDDNEFKKLANRIKRLDPMLERDLYDILIF
jgi:hypothetical protein